jgi:hypothetical protein
MTVNVCDFCGAKTELPVDGEWYKVYSQYWKSDDPYNPKSMDACEYCAEKIEIFIRILGVPFELSVARRDSSGFISIGLISIETRDGK